MADFYNDGIGRRSRKHDKGKGKGKKGRSAGLFLLDLLAVLFTVALVTATVTVLGMQYFEPDGLWLLPTITLGAPLVYVADIVVMLYWIMRWRWVYALVMLISVIAGTCYLPRYYKPEIARRHEGKYRESRYTRVITYNVANGNNSALVDSLRRMNPDIVCLQEFLSESKPKWDLLGEKYRSTFDGEEAFSCEIIVKSPAYRLLRKGAVGSLPRYNGIWADVATKSDTVRVVNLHLQSTGLRKEDTSFIEGHRYIYDNEREDKLQSILLRLAENSRKRAVQADEVKEFIATSPYPVIVCGDLNDVPLSYSYRALSDGLTDAFTAQGKGFAHTFDGYFSMLRIDHMFLSPQIEVCSYDVKYGWTFSDHYPVAVRLKRLF